MTWPVVVTIVGFLCAFVPVGVGWPDVPVPISEIVMVAGLAWAWRNAGTRRRKALAGVLTFGVAFHLTWLFVLSSYDTPTEAPAGGARVTDFQAVRVRDGATFTLAAQRGRDILLVLFRGAW